MPYFDSGFGYFGRSRHKNRSPGKTDLVVSRLYAADEQGIDWRWRNGRKYTGSRARPVLAWWGWVFSGDKLSAAMVVSLPNVNLMSEAAADEYVRNGQSSVVLGSFLNASSRVVTADRGDLSLASRCEYNIHCQFSLRQLRWIFLRGTMWTGRARMTSSFPVSALT